MIYNEVDMTVYAKLHDKTVLIGHPDIMCEMNFVDGSIELHLCLTPENVERFLAAVKEASLV